MILLKTNNIIYNDVNVYNHTPIYYKNDNKLYDNTISTASIELSYLNDADAIKTLIQYAIDNKENDILIISENNNSNNFLIKKLKILVYGNNIERNWNNDENYLMLFTIEYTSMINLKNSDAEFKKLVRKYKIEKFLKQ